MNHYNVIITRPLLFDLHRFAFFNSMMCLPIYLYLCVTLTLSILTITQRHGVVTTMLVASAACVGSGRARDEGWGETRACGRLGDVCGGGGVVVVCTVQRLVAIKHIVVPALSWIGQEMVPLLLMLGACSTGQLCGGRSWSCRHLIFKCWPD